jgi:hypothetical protein
MGVYLKVRVPALHANVGLGQKWLSVTNALAYYDTELIMALKSFFNLGPRWDGKTILLILFSVNHRHIIKLDWLMTCTLCLVAKAGSVIGLSEMIGHWTEHIYWPSQPACCMPVASTRLYWRGVWDLIFLDQSIFHRYLCCKPRMIRLINDLYSLSCCEC